MLLLLLLFQHGQLPILGAVFANGVSSAFAYGAHAAIAFEAGKVKRMLGVVCIMRRDKVTTGWVRAKHSFFDWCVELEDRQQECHLGVLAQYCPYKRCC
jgi:hypothetical protein